MTVELQPPTPAWPKDPSGHYLDTRDIKGLQRRGYIPTWPERATVYSVAGVPSDVSVPGGIDVVWNELNDLLYRRTPEGWLPVKGYPEGSVDMTLAPALPDPDVGGFADGFAGGF